MILNIDIRQIDSGEESIVIRYKEPSGQIKKILEILNGDTKKLTGRKDDRRVVIDPESILYIESVDDKTFAYTDKDVLRMDASLQGILSEIDDISFFRCSKSMIINVDKVKVLKSLSSNRIDATLENGEHVIISRTYASDFRKFLKGGYTRG
ncbi:MAG: LytTR family transcriptional regulator DNA-binding domain-containing protein [Lachnospiraceae bacterium]|nr:LytTR family transcriptional regulator DNA-binding domain-containing protein [Lachnospiraceae bacterium]